MSSASGNLPGSVPAPSQIVEDINTADLGQKSSRAAVISITARIGNLVLTLVAQAILGRLLTPSEYGIFAMGMTALAFLLVFREFGLQAAGVQKKTLTYEEASFLFWMNLVLISTLGVIGVLVAPIVAEFYGSEQVTTVLTVMSVASVLGGISAQHTMLLRRQMRFSALAFIDLCALAMGLAAGVIVGLMRQDVWALLAMYLTQHTMMTVLTFAVSRWIPGPLRFKSEHAAMLRFGAGVTGANLLFYLTNNIIAILIGHKLGEALMGHYNRAQQIFSIPANVMFSSAYLVVFASLSRLSGDAAAYKNFYCAALRRVSMFYMLLSGILIFSGDDLIRVLIGPGWTEAGRMLQILSFAFVGAGMSQMTSILLQSQSRLGELQAWSVIDSIIRIGCIALGSYAGAFGLVTAFALSTTLITAPASLWYVSRKGPVQLSDLIQAIRPGLAVFVLSAAGAYAGQSILVPAAEPGLLPLIISVAGALLFVLTVGAALPLTRHALLEILAGLYAIAPMRLKRLLPYHDRIAVYVGPTAFT